MPEVHCYVPHRQRDGYKYEQPTRKPKLGSVVGEVLLFPTTEDMERIIRVIGGSDST